MINIVMIMIRLRRLMILYRSVKAFTNATYEWHEWLIKGKSYRKMIFEEISNENQSNILFKVVDLWKNQERTKKKKKKK
jgi:hypothetical protein